MFDKASLKLGLDKAVLQSISGRQDQTMVRSVKVKVCGNFYKLVLASAASTI